MKAERSMIVGSKEIFIYVQSNRILLTTTASEKTWQECFEVVVSEVSRNDIPNVIDVLTANLSLIG